jgi:hypothetical protein
MNLENIRKVRDAIAKLQDEPKRFNMVCWVNYINDIGTEYTSFEDEQKQIVNSMKEGDCNTCACIGGWTVVVLDENWDKYTYFMDRGAELLGLTHEEAEKLFTPWDAQFNLIGDPAKAGPKEAVKVLTHILETGEIDWNAAWR